MRQRQSTDVHRRTLLKGLSGVLLFGSVPLFSETAGAWKRFQIQLDCPECLKLGKLEVADDGDIYIEPDEGTEVQEDVFEFDADFDGDGSADDTVRLTITDRHYKTEDEQEVVGVDFRTGGMGICEVHLKNGTHGTATYSDLGHLVRGTDFYAPKKDEDTHAGVSTIRFFYCPVIRVCVLSSENEMKPAQSIDPTSDGVRFGVWFGGYHRKDGEVYAAGAKPVNGNGTITDIDGDGVDDVCFEFRLRDALIDDPTSVKDPTKMKAELLIEDEDENMWAGESRITLVGSGTS